MSMPEEFKDPQRTLLFSGVAVAAVLAAAGAFLFFANVPAPGAAREQILAAGPKMERADIDRIIAARNAYAPRPSQVTRAELAEDAIRPRRDNGLIGGGAPGSEAEMAAPASLSDLAPPKPDAAITESEPMGNEGDALFRTGDYAAAMAYWRAQAELGDRWSAYRLGAEYLDGKPNVVRRDVAEGTRWIEMAAVKNEPRAQFELGNLYENGVGVRTSLTDAASWYLKSAERGHVRGQYNIATMLESGDGIAQDKVSALMFYTLAARQGFKTVPAGAEGKVVDDPASALLDLRSELSADQVREAERRAAAFKPIQD